jgi:glutamyl-tRNA reductase
MLEQAMKRRGNRPVFLIDLAIPRNIEPSSCELYNVYLYNIDDLHDIVEENRRARAMEVPAVEGIIAQHIGKFEAWQAAAELAATWAGLSQAEKVKLIEGRAEQIHPVSLEHRRRWIQQTSALLEAERDVDRSDASGRPGRMRSSMRALRILFGYGEERS